MDLTIERRLQTQIHQAIEDSIIGLSSTQEPDYIAALITNLPSRLSTILNTLIPSRNFKVGGCFIHQKPVAKFCDPHLSRTNPEIGDLLIVYKEIRATDTLYNVLLLQAKKASNIHNTHIPPADNHQLLLYTKWPTFEYSKAGILNGKVRKIHPKTINTGAQYLLINTTTIPPASHLTTFWCATPNRILDASNSLALQIVRLIDFQTGKPFVANGRNIDHWSRMIWDLLNLSASSVFNRRRAGYHGTRRYSGDCINMLLSSNIENDWDRDTEEEGISVLCIESKMED